ncbi:uncharacterized protein MYCFIDRAFT_62660 [Pseudocercospora fijiensis CIRAD86]|uniref:FAD-binding FR-type domain-containing protein n=1 Tax=Pseudocercospora fijiensis (strain CIRAD86) TaxID=383855 RepID=N1QAR1_PSEFD|nr:uncharacterized protein MYCFIDRAFT_62660 [Pseudocercospora fijiensis CIRAD86]EME88073.1 hypothetical protein MYCFIDRAFT_62660 [Pseudocercospora fijiensis CIRAD86]
MAAIFVQDLPWHDGESEMQKLMRVPDVDNPTLPALSPQLSNHLRIAPLIAIGTLDAERRPWTTLWGSGQKGLSQPLGGSIVGIKTPVPAKYDPVVELLVGKEANGEVLRQEDPGRMVSGLAIDLETRKRTKMYGRMIAGALLSRHDEITEQQEHIVETQLVLKIEQSLGNCPKYLNRKHIVPARSNPELMSDSPQLSQQALELIKKSDLFFVSSSQKELDMDTNHRGGPAGFLRVASNEASGAVLCWPEYSGNRLYQTLGNLLVTPRAGLCVPDFDTGDMLYLTGTTDILVGQDASSFLPRSNLAVKVTVESARFVSQALPFRGVPGDASPYNPSVRYLTSEKPPGTASAGTGLQQANLLSQEAITPTISRFKFSLGNAANYTAGQYVTFDLSSELDLGYSHMRDDDPRSLNDDFVRTFTVSSPPRNPPNPTRNLKDDEFEITIRKVGVATEWFFRQKGSTMNRPIEVGIKGFGGEFEIAQKDAKETIGFVAAGVGITPLLPSLGTLDLERLKVLWTLRKEDTSLVTDTIARHEGLEKALTVFVTNGTQEDEGVAELQRRAIRMEFRRIEQGDVVFDEQVERVYLCTAVPLRMQLMEWITGKELVFEDFNF